MSILDRIKDEWATWLVVAALVLGLAGWGFAALSRAEKEVAVMEAQSFAREADILRTENDGLKAENKANAEALARREAERAGLAAENEALRGQLEGIYENDAESRAWADAVVPDAVLGRLR